MVQLFETLLYKPEDCGFDFRWCQSHNPSARTMALGLIELLSIKLGIFPGGKGGRCIGVLHAPTVLKSGNPRDLPRLYRDLVYLSLTFSIPDRFVI